MTTAFGVVRFPVLRFLIASITANYCLRSHRLAFRDETALAVLRCPYINCGSRTDPICSFHASWLDLYMQRKAGLPLIFRSRGYFDSFWFTMPPIFSVRCITFCFTALRDSIINCRRCLSVRRRTMCQFSLWKFRQRWLYRMTDSLLITTNASISSRFVVAARQTINKQTISLSLSLSLSVSPCLLVCLFLPRW